MTGVRSPAPRSAWRQLLARDPDGLVCQSPEWLDAICAGGAFADASRLYETSSGGQMVLPLARRRNGLPRRLAPLGSMPAAWGMGGVLSDDPPTATDLRRIVADLRALPALSVTIRPNPLQAAAWEDATSGAATVALMRRAHVLDLTGGADAIWASGFASTARRAVRKAERAGLEVRSDASAGALRDYRALFDLSVARWAASQREPVTLARLRARHRDPPDKLVRMARALGPRFRLWMAYLDGRPVAGIVVLLGTNASYTRGAMDKARCGPVAANELLHWHAIQEACAAGCASYQMGESGESAGLSRFKEKLGARPVDYAEYRFERLPLSRLDATARATVKRAIGFRDVP